MMTAIQNPRTVSKTTVTTVKKNVVPTALQNWEPRVPGAQAAEPHCWANQWTKLSKPAGPPETKTLVTGSRPWSFWKAMIIALTTGYTMTTASSTKAGEINQNAHRPCDVAARSCPTSF